MWSVLTIPCLVETVQPSTSGSRSRCTPSRETSAGGVAAALTDFVDFVDKDDTVLLYSVDGFLLQLFRIDQFGRFFFNQQLHRVFDFQLTRFLLLAAEVLEHRLQLAGHLFHARRGHDFNAHRRRSEIDFNLFIVQLAFTQFYGTPGALQTVPATAQSGPSCSSPVGSARQARALPPALPRGNGSYRWTACEPF